jgi:hypothetical protein
MICMPWQLSLGLLSQNLPRILSIPTFHDRFHKNHVVGPYPEPYKSRLHYVIHLSKIHFNKFHCFTVHFNSLSIMIQQMHFYVIKH